MWQTLIRLSFNCNLLDNAAHRRVSWLKKSAASSAALWLRFFRQKAASMLHLFRRSQGLLAVVSYVY